MTRRPAARAALAPPVVAASALLVVGTCAPWPTPGLPPASASLRVMTYNVFAGNDLDRRSNLTRIAALIDSLGVDVALLQEVDRGTARSGRVDQAQVIAELTGMHVAFGPSMEFDGGEYGNAVLSRWPVRSARVLSFDATSPDAASSDAATSAASDARSREPRSLLHVVIAAPGGALQVLNTHLDHGADPRWRHAQQLQLLAYVADSVPRSGRVVLGGDLNARPDTPGIRALKLFFSDAWAACGSGAGHTFRSDGPDRRIDYVFLAGARCSRAWVHDTQLSDHRPVIVDVRTRT